MLRRANIDLKDYTAAIYKLEELRFENNWTQKQLAKEFGVCSTTISRISNFDHGMSMITWKRLQWFLRKHNKL